jgi:hypothetical protein
MIVSEIILFVITSALVADTPSCNHIEIGFCLTIVTLDNQIFKNLVWFTFDIEISNIVENKGVIRKRRDLYKRYHVQDDSVVQIHEASIIKKFAFFLEQVHWTNDQIAFKSYFLL